MIATRPNEGLPMAEADVSAAQAFRRQFPGRIASWRFRFRFLGEIDL